MPHYLNLCKFCCLLVFVSLALDDSFRLPQFGVGIHICVVTLRYFITSETFPLS